MNMAQLEALSPTTPTTTIDLDKDAEQPAGDTPPCADADYGSQRNDVPHSPIHPAAVIVRAWQTWLDFCFRRPVSYLRAHLVRPVCLPRRIMEDPERVRFIGVPTGANPRTWVWLIYTTWIVTGAHFVCGFISMAVGAITTVIAEHTIYAHTVSPIWSGLAFVAAGICGINAARRRTVYMIHLFIGTSVCALILLLISIQLLRLGLVYHTSDGNTYQKDQKDIWIIIALSDAGAEGLFCLIAVASSWKMARLADVPPEPVKDDGPFHIQITKGGSHYMTMSKYTQKRKISSL